MIATDHNITWGDFIEKCVNAIITNCCNVGGWKSDVPDNLKTMQTTEIRRIVTHDQTLVWNANPKNIMSVVEESTVRNEFTTFLRASNILNDNSNDSFLHKIIDSKDFSHAISLFKEFIAYHVKPVASRRDVLKSLAAQTYYKGQYYVTGTVSPSSPVTPNTNIEPAHSDGIIGGMVRENMNVTEMLKRHDSVKNPRYEVS